MTTFYSHYLFNKHDNSPMTLHQQCFQFILRHLEQFPCNSLALLPLKTCQQVLWSLPIADVCLLEATQFTKDMTMDDYWKAIIHTSDKDLGCHSVCLDCIQNTRLCSPCRWKSIVASISAKEWVHAAVVAEAITKKGLTVELTPSSELKALHSTVNALSFIRNPKQHDLYTFLYAVRWFTEDEDSGRYTDGVKCEFEFPPRYRKYEAATFIENPLHGWGNQFQPLNATELKSLMDAITCCFGQRKLTVLCTTKGLLDDISEEVADFFSNLQLFSCQICEPYFEEIPLFSQSHEVPSLKAILKRTVGLEVLHIQNDCDKFCSSFPIDSLFRHIASQPFLASLNILAISEAGHSHFDISEGTFEDFKEALKSKNRDHHQGIQIEGIIIKRKNNNHDYIIYTTYNLCKICPDSEM